MGYARMLKELDLTREESDSFIDEILGAYDRMVEMTNELLNFALLSEAPVAHHSDDPFSNFSGRLVGEGDRQDAGWHHSFLVYEIGDAVGKSAGFAAACAGQQK